MQMTKRRWIEQRQENSKVPWAEIRASGWDAVPCDCGREGCEGWRLEKVGRLEPEQEAA